MLCTEKIDKHKPIIISIIILVIVITCLMGCGKVNDLTSDKPPATVISETDTELTIVDQAGREVTVKKEPQSIALCYRVVIRFLLNLEQGDKIKGIGKSEPFLEKLQPSLKDAMDVGQGVADIEALAQLKPDIFFHKASDVETLEAVEKIGIPSIGIDVETPEDMVVAIELMGKVCNAEEKANTLISYYEDSISTSEKLAKSIDDKDRKTAIVMGSSIGKVADESMLQGEMLKMAGAVNCAENLTATELWPTAGVEQIFAWNPEYIFITGSESALYNAETLYKDKAWSEIKAVKNKNVYVMPAAEDSWEFPGIVSALGIDYMMHIMYPELLDDKTLERHVDELYELSYGMNFSREELGY